MSDRPGSAVDGRAVLLLGSASALALATTPDALLLPHVDRAPTRAVALVAAAMALSIPWWLTARRRRPTGRAALLVISLLALVGGATGAALLPALREQLVTWMAEGGPLPFYVLVAGMGFVASLATLAPLGWLVGLALDERPGALAAWLAGAGLMLVLTPYLGEMLLGREGCLTLAGALAAAAGVVVAESAPVQPRPATLPTGGGLLVVALGVAAALAARLAAPVVELGSTGAAWLAGVTCLAAALGTSLRRWRPFPVLAVGVAVAAALLPGTEPAVRAVAEAGIAGDLLRILAVAAPLGLVAGWLLATRGEGASVAAVPVLVLAPLPVVSLALLPRLGPTGTAAVAAAATLWVALSSRPRLGAAEWIAPAVVTAAVVALPLPAAPGGVAPADVRFLADGVVGRAPDVDGTARWAVDGLAPLGRHDLATHRLVHLPLLFRPAADTLLVIASDGGDGAAAALEHRPERVHWLRPFALPGVGSGESWPFLEVADGSERLFLAGVRPEYEAIVMLPDPRVRRRAALVSTEEFYEQVLEHLAEDGVFCQWWDLADSHVDDIKPAIASANATFESTYLLVDHPRSRRGLIAIVGGRAPLELDPAELDGRLAALPRVRDEFIRVGLDGLLTACLVVQHDGVLELLAPAAGSVSDDRPLLGVRGGLRSLDQPGTLLIGRQTFLTRRCDPMSWLDVPEEDEDAVRAHVRDILRGWQLLIGGADQVVTTEGATVPAFESEEPGRGPEVEAAFHAEALASLPDWPYLHRLVLAFAERLESDGRRADAEQYLRRAITYYEASAPIRFALASVVERKGDIPDAIVLYRTALAFDPEHAGALAALARLERG